MNNEMCRLCLTKDNLSPIFTSTKSNEEHSAILCITTGLKIEINDGLPQVICNDCTESVNTALNLRSTSNSSELKLLQLSHEKTECKNINEDFEKIQIIDDKISLIQDNIEDSYDFNGFEIAVELDRITEQDGANMKCDEDTELVKPKIRNMSVKEKRALYMTLVDGIYDPKMPVKCKVCKRYVSKWSCFINHAKKHLGFKNICEYCGKTFISSSQLKRHCRSFHGMERDLKCKHCTFLALDKPQLLVHERRMHTGDRPYICDTCQSSYYSRKCLLQHIESHITTASVQCDQCPALLKSKRHLAKHRYSAHGGKRRRRRIN